MDDLIQSYADRQFPEMTAALLEYAKGFTPEERETFRREKMDLSL